MGWCPKAHNRQWSSLETHTTREHQHCIIAVQGVTIMAVGWFFSFLRPPPPLHETNPKAARMGQCTMGLRLGLA